jgi:hypothetical protein
VDLIKIDVEGHEQAVLRGSSKTIEICRPIIICEIEQRHIKKSIQDVFREIEAKEYIGKFIYMNKIRSLFDFDLNIHQNEKNHDVSGKNYVNNFVFLPR